MAHGFTVHALPSHDMARIRQVIGLKANADREEPLS